MTSSRRKKIKKPRKKKSDQKKRIDELRFKLSVMYIERKISSRFGGEELMNAFTKRIEVMEKELFSLENPSVKIVDLSGNDMHSKRKEKKDQEISSYVQKQKNVEQVPASVPSPEHDMMIDEEDIDNNEEEGLIDDFESMPSNRDQQVKELLLIRKNSRFRNQFVQLNGMPATGKTHCCHKIFIENKNYPSAYVKIPSEDFRSMNSLVEKHFFQNGDFYVPKKNGFILILDEIEDITCKHVKKIYNNLSLSVQRSTKTQNHFTLIVIANNVFRRQILLTNPEIPLKTISFPTYSRTETLNIVKEKYQLPESQKLKFMAQQYGSDLRGFCAFLESGQKWEDLSIPKLHQEINQLASTKKKFLESLKLPARILMEIIVKEHHSFKHKDGLLPMQHIKREFAKFQASNVRLLGSNPYNILKMMETFSNHGIVTFSSGLDSITLTVDAKFIAKCIEGQT